MPSLVLLPGTLCDERLFAAQNAGLAGLVEITISDLTRDDTIEAMARRVLAEAPPVFSLAGLSLGGIVAIEMVRQAPDRVERLALLDTNHLPPTEDQLARWAMFDDLVAVGRFDEITSRHLLPDLLHRRAGPERELVLDMARHISAEGFLRQNAAVRHRPDARPVLGTIGCPTLVLCGAEDRVCPVELHEEMAGAIPGAELEVIAGAGHLSTLDRPAAVTGELERWLQRATLPALRGRT